MSFLNLLLVLVFIGVIVYAVNTLIPMDQRIKNIISIVGVLIAVFYVFMAFGLIHGLESIKVPHL